MVLGDCTEGFIRLFFVFIAFCFNHLGWGITFFFAFVILLWFLQRFGLGYLQIGILVIVLFFLSFGVAAYYFDVPFCAFTNEVSQLLV